MKGYRMIARIVTAVFLCTGVALADYQLDFTIPSFAAGSISYAGGSAPLVGSGIAVSSVASANAPLNSSVLLNCTGCVLSFTTGNLISATPGLYAFGSGGTFTLHGSIAGIVSDADLLSGAFSATSVVLQAGILDVAAGFFSTDVNQALTDYFGLPTTPPQYSGAMGVVFAALPTKSGSFSSIGILSGNVVASVPEPATIVFLGTVLLGCAAIARRRMV
jgi:hypothetical protein